MLTVKRVNMWLPFSTLLFCGPAKVATLSQFDIAVVAVDITPAPAGHPSDAQVTVANRGTRMLRPQDYLIEIKAPGSPEEMRGNACGTPGTHVFIDTPEEIEPGRMALVTVHHIFARAGSYAITVQATLAVPEDGSTGDNVMIITRTVPSSPCSRYTLR
jgi:hypothetical protein